jgi:hypothetical protein
MEDDDGFVFTRPAKQKRKIVAEDVPEPKIQQPTKPSFMDFAEVTFSYEGDL